MALSRKFLSALGIEADKVDEIIAAHSETVDGLKEEIQKAKSEAESFKAETETYKSKAEKVEELQKEVDSLREEAEKGNSDSDSWKVKYEALKEEDDKLKGEFDEFKKTTKAKETHNAKEKAYRNLLKETGILEKRIDSVIKVTNLDNFELDDEGNIKDADKQMASIKEEWADFIPKTSEKGADTAMPPAHADAGAKTKEEIMAIKDRSERQKAIAENPKLFGITE